MTSFGKKGDGFLQQASLIGAEEEVAVVMDDGYTKVLQPAVAAEKVAADARIFGEIDETFELIIESLNRDLMSVDSHASAEGV